MGKAVLSVAWAQWKRFLLGAGASLVAILGIVSAAFGLLDAHLRTEPILLLIGLAVIASVILNIKSLITPQVIVDDIIPPDADNNFHLRVHCPCDRKIAREANKLASNCFARSFTIAPEVFEQLRVKNRYILACMTNSRGEFAGYFDVIPVKSSFALPLLNGTITEESITHEDVLSETEMKKCEYLFVSGFAICNPDTHAGRRNANAMAWAILKYLDHFYGSSKPNAFAIAATRSGDELLQRFKIDLMSEGASRRDNSRIYSIILTRAEIVARLAWLPDWSKLCILDWTPNVTVFRGARPRRPRLPQGNRLDQSRPGQISAKVR